MRVLRFVLDAYYYAIIAAIVFESNKYAHQCVHFLFQEYEKLEEELAKIESQVTDMEANPPWCVL